MTNQQSPATAVDNGDPGDETQRRFRYQITYSVLKALQLLTASPTHRAVFCEQIEDLLIERQDGKFVGIQIKTRELDQTPFRSSDPAIVSALCRFCVRDARFAGWFVLFILATNFVFHEGEGVDDLRNILTCARENRFAELGPRDKIRIYLGDLAQKAALPIEAVITTLAKVSLEERKTGIDQPELELPHALGQIDRYQGLRMDQLLHGARLLSGHFWSVSSLALDEFVLETHSVTEDFGEHLQRLRASRKRVDAEILRTVMDPAATADTSSELLTIRDFLAREQIPPGLALMQMKMAAGAVTYLDIQQMKDDVASLESSFVHWKERYGLPEANRRLAHFEHLSLRAARVAQQLERRPDGGAYGQAMLQRLRNTIEEICAAGHETLFGCRPEHLVGAAGLLSEECKIWWDERGVGARGGDAP